MEADNWKTVSDRYLTDEAKADFVVANAAMPAKFDQADYPAKWADLSGRIERALPLDPASPAAQAFHDEWQALLEPFTAVATPAMMQGVSKMYDGIDSWKGEQQPPFSSSVWQFVKAVGEVRKTHR
ncbi:TipAS antibiotic-recognition domain-containing protein [uncultured Sphingomonas sp.]|uniref:TipAS antibiotic-recognition domain-containing protein n=1 Tax=uncultured Sphingomonas sp. TaxID=158754 RepID=UPI0035CA9EC6